MAGEVSHVTFVGVYSEDHNDVFRRGLNELNVSFSEVSIPQYSLSEAAEEKRLPLLTMRATMNWFSSTPSWLFTILVLGTLAYHTLAIWVLMVANYGSIREADVLVVPHMGDSSVLAVKPIAVVMDTPLVFLSHNGMFYTLIENRGFYPKSSVAGRLVYYLDWLTQSLADAVVVFSGESGRRFSHTFAHRSDKYRTIYISFDESKFDESKPISLEKPGQVVYWGNFHPHHGPLTMVEAAAKLPDVPFVFAGESVKREAVMEHAESLGVDNIEFPGHFSPPELVSLIQPAEIVLGPLGDNIQTTFTIGTKVAEAAYFEKAIIVGDQPGVNEVFDHLESAYLVEPGNSEKLADAIKELLQDDEFRRKLGKGAHELYMTQFASTIAAARLVEIGESIDLG